MKVALVVDRFDPLVGGLEQWTVSLARFLAGRGHDVHVLTFAQAGHDTGATVHLLAPVFGDFARAKAVEAALPAIAASVVHDTGTSWSGDVFQPQTGSRRFSQARLVATHPPLLRVRAALSPVSMARRRAMDRLESRQIGRAKRIIAVSRLVRGILEAQHGLGEARFTVIPNGIDTARFAPEQLAPLRKAARESLGLGTAIAFLASAHNMHLKGVDTAMEALARLAAGGADVRLMVAGNEPGAFWRQLAERLGVAGRVHFLGPVAAMEPLFAAADALVHPTRWDACSLSTIEAGAAGLPAITTAMNGAAELIADGQTGFVLPRPNDPAALAARMECLLDAGLRNRMGRAAHAAAAGHDLQLNLAAVERVLIDTASAI